MSTSNNLELELLIHGYCRPIQKLLIIQNDTSTIPLSIIELLILFYQKHGAIISIAIGQCGKAINCIFYKTLMNEYKLDLNGKINDDSYIDNIYFRQQLNDKSYSTARCLLVDLQGIIGKFSEQNESLNIFSRNNNICGASGAGNNWAKGHYTEGAELIDDIMDSLRKEVEKSDEPQGFQIVHSLGGGTGSGLGTLIMRKLKDLYPQQIVTSFSIFPTGNVSDVYVEPYNAMLSLNVMHQFCDCIFMIDNQSLFNKAKKEKKSSQNVTYQDLNKYANSMINEVTSIFRYNDSYGFNLKSFTNEMIKYKNLKYLTTIYPLIDDDGNFDVNNIGDESYSYCNIFEHQSLSLSSLIINRGFDSNLYEGVINKLQTKCRFKDEIILTSIKPSSSKQSTMITNNSSIKEVFQSLSAKYARMYRRKAFMHWYKGEGMDEMEFYESDKNLRDLITEYQDKEDEDAQQNNLDQQDNKRGTFKRKEARWPGYDDDGSDDDDDDEDDYSD